MSSAATKSTTAAKPAKGTKSRTGAAGAKGKKTNAAWEAFDNKKRFTAVQLIGKEIWREHHAEELKGKDAAGRQEAWKAQREQHTPLARKIALELAKKGYLTMPAGEAEAGSTKTA